MFKVLSIVDAILFTLCESSFPIRRGRGSQSGRGENFNIAGDSLGLGPHKT